MNYTKSKNDQVNEYIEKIGEEKELFLKIREVILSVEPSLAESIKWKNCLVYTTNKNIIQTVLGKKKVSLIFFEGASFRDEWNELNGDGNKTRTMRIESLNFNETALRAYVKLAIKASAV